MGDLTTTLILEKKQIEIDKLQQKLSDFTSAINNIDVDFTQIIEKIDIYEFLRLFDYFERICLILEKNGGYNK